MKWLYNQYQCDRKMLPVFERVLDMDDPTGDCGPVYRQFEEAICSLPNLCDIKALRQRDCKNRPAWRGVAETLILCTLGTYIVSGWTKP